MFEPNVQKLLAELKPEEVVLDIGGWACPFNRANWVMDAEPYATRGYYATFGGKSSQGGEKEFFTEATWIQRDICERTPYPFADKSLDFAVCSHTMEDIRDPLWVCSELIRVAKRGYIEIPSRLWETCRGWERPTEVGLSHHRWLIDIEGNRISFLMKFHMIHCHWRFSFPASFGRTISPEKAVQWLWWDDSFEFGETTIHRDVAQEQELERFVAKNWPYPAWKLGLDSQLRRGQFLARRATQKLARLVGK